LHASSGDASKNWITGFLIDWDLLEIEFYHFLGTVNREFYPGKKHSSGR